jgi:hypothetical protein
MNLKILLVQIIELGPSLYIIIPRVFMRFSHRSHPTCLLLLFVDWLYVAK